LRKCEKTKEQYEKDDFRGAEVKHGKFKQPPSRFAEKGVSTSSRVICPAAMPRNNSTISALVRLSLASLTERNNSETDDQLGRLAKRENLFV
jgi:hypothetical protein